MILHPLSEHASLILQERLGRLAILGRQVIGILRKPLAGQDVFQDDQQSQIFACFFAEELRNPAQCLRTTGVRILERLELAQIVSRPVPRLVEREINHQFPRIVIPVFKRGLVQFPNVLEQHGAGPLGVLPEEIVVLLELAFSFDSQLLEQHLADAADSISATVNSFVLSLLDDGLGIDARKLDGDDGIRLLADPNLSDTGGPVATAAQNFLAFTASDGRLDRAMIQCRESLRVESSQRLDLRHQRGQQQRFDQTIVVAKRHALRIIDR